MNKYNSLLDKSETVLKIIGFPNNMLKKFLQKPIIPTTFAITTTNTVNTTSYDNK